jgi:hypothetical protein
MIQTKTTTLTLRQAALILALVGLGLRLAFALLPLSIHLIVLEDDAWMVTAIARNFALGRGITADGVNPTNGFQPLYPLTLGAIPYLVAPNALDAGFTVNLMFCALLNALAAWPLWILARRFGGEVAGLIAVALFALNPLIIRASVNAMETSLGLVLLLTLFVAFYRLDQTRVRNVLLLALLTALAVLARLDASLAFAAVTLTMVLRMLIEGQQANGENTRGIRNTILTKLQQPSSFIIFRSSLVGLYIVTTLFLLVPYFAFNYAVSRTLGPSSGAALAYMHSFGPEYALSNGLKGFYYNSAFYLEWAGTLPLLLLPLVVLGLIVFVLRRKLFEALPLLLYIPVPLLYYGYLLQQFKARYFLGFSTVLIILLAWIGAELLHRGPNRQMVLAVLSATTALILFNTFGAYRWYQKEVNQPGQTQPTSYRAALWIRDNLPPNALIGAKNSGIYQYYSGHTVLNIDGKLNHEIIPAMEHRILLDYLRRRVTYLVDREQTLAQHVMFYSEQFGDTAHHRTPTLLERITIYWKLAVNALQLGPPPDLASPPDNFSPSRPFSYAAEIVQTFVRPNDTRNPVVVYRLR